MKSTLNLIFLSFTIATSAYSGVFSKTKRATVKVTNMAGNSGGTGIIMKSTESISYILTNAHVCRVAKKGGRIVTTFGVVKQVQKIKESKVHDLCLVSVVGNLEVNTDLAKRPPKLDQKIIVSGHPFLLPHTYRPGHLSSPMIIKLVVDVRKCTEAERKKENIMCAFMGMPMLKEYEAQAISSMIAPGNSGSGVYNVFGDLVGVVFAGRTRGFGNGIIVPYSYVRNFLKYESRYLKWSSVKKIRPYKSISSTTRANVNEKVLPEQDDIFFPAIQSSKYDLLFDAVVCFAREPKSCLNQ